MWPLSAQHCRVHYKRALECTTNAYSSALLTRILVHYNAHSSALPMCTRVHFQRALECTTIAHSSALPTRTRVHYQRAFECTPNAHSCALQRTLVHSIESAQECTLLGALDCALALPPQLLIALAPSLPLVSATAACAL